MASSKYNIDFQLPSIENQEYIFQHGFFTQELLPYQADKDRQVYIMLLSCITY